MVEMKPLQLKAYEYMKQKLQDGYFQEGCIYSETKIAAEIGVSRTPFRDAIHRLTQEGYIDIIPSKGFQIHEIDIKDMIETFQMRTAIEGFCATDAARNSDTVKSQKLFQKLECLIEKQKECAYQENIKDLVRYDNEFHTELVKYAENSIFDDIFEMNLYRIGSFASVTLVREGRVPETLGEHTRILEAMRGGDWKLAVEAVNVHMARPQELIMIEVEKKNS